MFCKRKGQTVGGYHWAYFNDLERQEELKDFIGKEKIAEQARPVICIETQQVYTSIGQANFLGKGSVWNACQNNNHTAGGYHWAYLDDISQQGKLKKFIGKEKITEPTKAVICIETQIIYNSIAEAEKILNISHISLVCSNKQKTAGGYHWAYANDIKRQEELKNFINKKPQPYIKKILCIETGIIYNSLEEVIKNYPNILKPNLCKVCKGERKTTGGYHWKYVEEE